TLGVHARMDEVIGGAAVGTAAPAREGSAANFEAFFEAEHLRMFRALWLLTRSRHEAEELMQDAFLKVWERWDRVSGLSDPEGYLYRTAMNLFRSRLRRAAVALRKT